MLELIDIQKSYENHPLLKGITFSVSPGETICLLGASGSGKSTLLRLVAGLEEPEHGQVLWDGQDMISLPAHLRNFGLVFQDYALFPHLDVAGNVAFGLRMKKTPPTTLKARVASVLKKVNLTGFETRRVTELSGGEQQRVALARALASGPRLLMFDEPLGALDRSLKDDLLGELRRILREAGIPSIYVTHDQEEAFAIADRILLLHEGCIVQDGTPAEVYTHPASAWVAQFLDAGNIIPGVVRDGIVETPIGEFHLSCGHVHQEGDNIHVLVNSRKLCESPDGELRGVVADAIFQQEGFKVTLTNNLVLHLPEAPVIGTEIRLHIPPASVQCLP
jgi:spermidine/putrescine transport system ATP-binding protein